jgi:hypothetical protein
MYDTELAALAAREPWRQRVGYPNTVDDPLFIPEEHEECDGEVVREEGSKYWRCQSCGYIGWSTSTKHYPIMEPREFYEWCREFYKQARLEETDMSVKAISDQMFFVMAVALKRASQKRPEELREFLEALDRL